MSMNVVKNCHSIPRNTGHFAPALELNSGTVLHALSMLGGVKISNSNMVDRTRREQERVNYKRLNSRSSADFFGLFKENKRKRAGSKVYQVERLISKRYSKKEVSCCAKL